MKTCPFCAEEIQDNAIVCKHCRRELNKPPRKFPTRQVITIILILVIIAAVFYIKTESDRIRTQINDSLTSPIEYDVTYKVTGSAVKATVSYMNEQGGMEQTTPFIPYQKKITVESGAVLSIAAQNKGNGTITCEIWIGSELVKTSTSTAEYGMVTCADVVK